MLTKRQITSNNHFVILIEDEHYAQELCHPSVYVNVLFLEGYILFQEGITFYWYYYVIAIYQL